MVNTLFTRINSTEFYHRGVSCSISSRRNANMLTNPGYLHHGGYTLVAVYPKAGAVSIIYVEQTLTAGLWGSYDGG